MNRRTRGDKGRNALGAVLIVVAMLTLGGLGARDLRAPPAAN